MITPGQRGDSPQFKLVLEKNGVPRLGPGRPHSKPDSVAADRAYSNRPCLQYLRRRGIPHTILEDRQPGRPPAQGVTRRTTTGLRRGPVQETQRRRAGHLQAQAPPSAGHPLRQARLRIHRNRHRPRHLAEVLTPRPVTTPDQPAAVARTER
ncbi:hypothetical protein [Streptomyces sp. NBC_01077]|uniref:hypothetical protein n=1 Tax=Streptomyces sp. NBC_01077 TaxID=2903746 RepID=UPI00386A03CC